jgi:periplasmic protein TonB
MYVDKQFSDDENTQRLSFGIGGALLAHALILIWFCLPQPQKIISPDTFSSPTSVSFRFTAPAKELVIEKPPEPVQETIKTEPVKTKPVIKKVAKAEVPEPVEQELNKIEPAAPSQPSYQPEPKPLQQELIEVSKPVRDTIPVISDAGITGRRVQPDYPKRALRMRQEGVVWLHVLIAEDGKRQEIKLYKPSQYALLNEAALEAVKKWTFDPNIVNGRPVQSWVEIPVEFKIQ